MAIFKKNHLTSNTVIKEKNSMKNQFILSGNVGQKPELKESKNGKKYLSFSVAVNESYKPKDSDEYVTKTEWFNMVVYDRKAEGLAKVLDKGTGVVVSGKLVPKTQEVEGKKIKTLELVVFDVNLMSSKKAEAKQEDSDMDIID